PPGGQQLSAASMHIVCVPASSQCASQVIAEPTRRRSVHPICGQPVGQLPSQVSPAAISTTPLPHTAGQALSLLLLQPLGQQPSPLAHVDCWPVTWQAA